MTASGHPDEIGTAEAAHAGRGSELGASLIIPDDLAGLEARLLAGDVATFEALYRSTSVLIYSLALGALSDEREATDVTEQVYVTAWQRREELRAHSTPVRAWLISHARRLIGERSRVGSTAAGRRGAHAHPVSADDSRQITQRVIDAVVVADALTRTSEPHRDVMRLSFFETRTHTEIAKALGLPLPAVERAIKLTLSELSAHLRLSDAAP